MTTPKKPGRPAKPAHLRRKKDNFTLSQEVLNQLQIVSEATGESKSALVEKCVRKQFEKPQYVKILAAAISSGGGDKPAPAVFSKPEKIIPIRSRAHILAAAGSPICAEVTDWDGADDTILVKIAGLSMAPLLNDGDIVPMKLKSVSRSPYMKKGLIYLVRYDGGLTVKRYNTRSPKPEEKGQEWVVDGKVKVLESENPEHPEIIIKQELEWVGWLERETEKKLRASLALI